MIIDFGHFLQGGGGFLGSAGPSLERRVEAENGYLGWGNARMLIKDMWWGSEFFSRLGPPLEGGQTELERLRST